MTWQESIVLILFMLFIGIVGTYIIFSAYRNKIKLIDKEYGLDNLLKLLGWDEIEYPVIGVWEVGGEIVKAMYSNISLSNISKVNKTLIPRNGLPKPGRIRPISIATTRDEYRDQYCFFSYTDFFLVDSRPRRYKNRRPGMNVDYVIDAKLRKFAIKKYTLENLYWYAPDAKLSNLLFEKLEDVHEIISLDTLKQIVLDWRRVGQHLLSKYVTRTINGATTFEQLIAVMKKLWY